MTSKKNAQFLLPLSLFCLSEWVQIARDPPTLGRQHLGYQPPSPTPILFAILAKKLEC